jgi:FkbM family methyltransferase
MRFVRTLADRLWGTPVYEYGRSAYVAAIRAYLSLDPGYTLSVGDASAEFRPASFAEWNNLTRRIWDESDVLEHVLSHVRPGDVFFDVGANIGIYACLVDSLLTDGVVVPFEPYPPNVARLEANLAANDIDAPVWTRPLSDRAAPAELRLYGAAGPGAQHVSLDETYPTGEVVETLAVETVPGDRLVAMGEVPRPTVVKVDVQGTGPAVLRGLRESLTDDRCRLVYAEAHDNAGELRDLFGAYGFETGALGVDRPGKDPTIVGYDNGTTLN